MARSDNKEQGGKHYAKAPAKKKTTTTRASASSSSSSRSKTSGTRSTSPGSTSGTTKRASSTSSKSTAKHAAPKKRSTSQATRSKSTATTKRTTPRKSAPKKAAPAPRKPRRRRHTKLKLFIIVFGLIAIFSVVKIHMMTHPVRIDDEGFEHASKYADCLIVDGIDVSYAQATIKDWRKIKRSGVDFVIIRAGYRASATGELNTDSYFESNIKGAKKAGIMVGAYFFSQATNTKEAKKEADYLMQLVADYDIDLPLVMDYETVPGGRLEKALSSGKLTTKKLNKIARAFASEVESGGYESMIYANLDFLTHRFSGPKLADDTNIWMAHFNSSTYYDGDYMIWQCSDASKVPGIKGNVDKDFMYIDTEAVIKTRGARNEGAKSLGECQVEIASHSNTFIGANVEPGAKVYDGRHALKEGKDYRVSYVHNTQAGTGYMIVTGLGDYKDQVTMSFMIKGIT